MQFQFGQCNRPAFGHRVSGDGTFAAETDDAAFAAIIDGLGHGPEAAASAERCVEILGKEWSADVETIAGRLHKALAGMRGAAAGLMHIDRKTGEARYVGIGNTTARCWDSGERRMVSRDGVLGSNLRKLAAQKMTLAPGATILLYTDGVSSHFRAEEYPGLLRDHPRVAARRVVKSFGKELDDAACVVVRCEA